MIKPNKVIYLAILSFGISFGMMFQLSNLSSIFKFLGIESRQLSFLWLIPPIAGLLVQPLIGQLSDDTITRYGKRRPYIIGWGAVSSISFFLSAFFNQLLVIIFFMCLITIGLNGCIEMLRTLTSDLYQSKERSKAFAFQAFGAGIGAGLGTSLPFMVHQIYLLIGYKPILISAKIPSDLELSFIIAGSVIAIAVFISMLGVTERHYTHKNLLEKKHKKSLEVFLKKSIKIFNDLWRSLKNSSYQFKKICIIHAMSWFGIFIFWMYFSTALSQNLYDHTLMVHTKILQAANLEASFYLSIYQYVSVFYTLILFFLLSYSEKIKLIHGISLIIGSAGIITLYISQSKIILVLSMMGVGILWGSILILPYIIISQVIPKGKFGVYFGLFNVSVTIPQILSGFVMSPIYIYLFKAQALYVMLAAGVLIFFSALLWIKESSQ